jgi:hypothetical protein
MITDLQASMPQSALLRSVVSGPGIGLTSGCGSGSDHVLRWAAKSVLWTYSLLSRPQAQHVAVRWWRRFPSSAAGTSSWPEGVSDIAWSISILTRIKKHRAVEHLWLHLIASLRVRS